MAPHAATPAEPRQSGFPQADRRGQSEVFLLRGDDRRGLQQRCGALVEALGRGGEIDLLDLAFTLNTDVPSGGSRLAMVAASIEQLRSLLGRAAELLADPRCRQIHDTQGIYYAEEPLAAQGRLAFLFPGEGAQYVNMLADLLPHFPEVREHFQRCDQISLEAGKWSEPFTRGIFLPESAAAEARKAAEENLARLDNAVSSVLVANWCIWRLLRRLGLEADAVAGHSSGEISALAAAGCIEPDDRFFAELFALGRLLQQEEDAGHMADAALLVVAAGCRQVGEVIARCGSPAFVAMDNCPHQTVVAGTIEAVSTLEEQLRAAGMFCERLPFCRAYHTPLFEPYLGPIARMYEAITIGPPRLPVYSCVTGKRFPEDPAEIRRLAVAHWAGRVEFGSLIQAMYDDGVRLFVEVGPRGNLASFTQDILRGRPALAVAANVAHRSGVSQINHLVAQLAAHHVPLELDHLYARRSPQRLPWKKGSELFFPVKSVAGSLPPQEKNSPHPFFPPTASSEAVQHCLQASSGTRAKMGTSPCPPAPREQVLSRYFEVMEDFLKTQQEVHARFLGLLQRVGVGGQSAAQPPADTASATAWPMIGEILEHQPGRGLVMRRRIDVEEDLYAGDHTLGGRDASAVDRNLRGLAMMPMALNLEMMAEVASLLIPGKLVIGFQRVRLQRWIPLYDEPVTLELRAQAVAPPQESAAVATHAVAIGLRDLGNATQPGHGESPSVDGTVLLGDRYPSPPPAGEFPLRNQRPCPIGAAELYHTDRRLFHGPLFQAVCSVGRMGDDGVEGELVALSHAGLFRSQPQPALLTDPLLIDASTHVLGCWHLAQPDPRGRVVFPYELGSVRLFGPPPAEGTRLTCRVTILRSSARQVSHRIELIAPDGRLWCRLDPAEYWRFYWPPQYVAFFRHHDEHLVSHDWPAALLTPALPMCDVGAAVALPHPSARGDSATVAPTGSGEKGGCPLPPPVVRYLQIDEAPDVVEPVNRAALARVSLAPAEWEQFYRMQGPERRKTQWLFGRIAAKDCVRALWQRQCGERLFPADIEIYTDQHGRPLARHRGAAAPLPEISIAHSEDLVVALAGFGRRVGIDVERIEPRRPELIDAALDRQEQELLEPFGPGRDEAVTRFWCAKEAVAKALGRGLAEGPRSLAVRRFEPATGRLALALGENWQSLFPALRTALLEVSTRRHEQYIVAVSFLEPLCVP